MPSDFPPKDPTRTTQRGTIPPAETAIARAPTIPPPVPTPKLTPTSVPSVRDINRSTPIPINVERFVQQILATCLPLGNAEKFVRELLLEGLATKVPEMIRGRVATRTTALVASNLLRILSDGE